MPKLSIIVPTLNSGATIDNCLRSIACQTFADYEVIVQDGGSSDDTLDRICSFRSANEGAHVTVFREKDDGPYDAMNKGMRRARGEWLYFLGSDDEIYNPHVLTRVIAGPEIEKHDVIYGSVKVVGETAWAKNNPVYGGAFDLEKLLTRNICHQAIFYRRRFLKKIGKYNTDYFLLADWDLNMRCWSRTEFKYIDIIVAKFRAGGLSGTGDDERFMNDLVGNVLKYFNLSLWHPYLNAPVFLGHLDVVKMKGSRFSLPRVASRVRRMIRPHAYG